MNRKSLTKRLLKLEKHFTKMSSFVMYARRLEVGMIQFPVHAALYRAPDAN